MKAYRYASLARSVKELETAYGLLQIVELDNDGCVVGYRPKDGVNAGRWLHWGPGVGGYKATVGRFMAGPMWNPGWKPPKKQKQRWENKHRSSDTDIDSPESFFQPS